MGTSKAGGKPGFVDFAKSARPMRQQAKMISENTAAAPEGFERTVATRIVPQLAAEMAEGQSLKAGLKLEKEPVGLQRYFARKAAYHKGDKE